MVKGVCAAQVIEESVNTPFNCACRWIRPGGRFPRKPQGNTSRLAGAYMECIAQSHDCRSQRGQFLERGTKKGTKLGGGAGSEGDKVTNLAAIEDELSVSGLW